MNPYRNIGTLIIWWNWTSYGSIWNHQMNTPEGRTGINLEIYVSYRDNSLSLIISDSLSREEYRTHLRFLHTLCRHWDDCRNRCFSRKWMYQWTCGLWNWQTLYSINFRNSFFSYNWHNHGLYNSSYLIAYETPPYLPSYHPHCGLIVLILTLSF